MSLVMGHHFLWVRQNIKHYVLVKPSSAQQLLNEMSFNEIQQRQIPEAI